MRNIYTLMQADVNTNWVQLAEEPQGNIIIWREMQGNITSKDNITEGDLFQLLVNAWHLGKCDENVVCLFI